MAKAPKAPGENGSATLDDSVSQVIGWLKSSKYRGAPDRLNELSAMLITRGEVDLAHEVALANPPEERATSLARLAAHLPKAAAAAKKALSDAERGDDYDVGLRSPRTAAAHVLLEGVTEAVAERLAEMLDEDRNLTPAIDALLELGEHEAALEWLQEWMERKPLGEPMGAVADADLVGRVAGALLAAGDAAKGKKLLAAVPERNRHNAVRAAAIGLATRPRKQVESILALVPDGEKRSVQGALAGALRDSGRESDAEAIAPTSPIELARRAIESGDLRTARKLLKEKKGGPIGRLRVMAGIDDLDDAIARAEAKPPRPFDAIKRVAFLYEPAACVSGMEGVEAVDAALARGWKSSGVRAAKKKKPARAVDVQATALVERARGLAQLDDEKSVANAIAAARVGSKKVSYRAQTLFDLTKVALAAGLPLEAYECVKQTPPTERREAAHLVALAYLPDDLAGAMLVIDGLVPKDDRFFAGAEVVKHLLKTSGTPAAKKRPTKKTAAKKRPTKKTAAKKTAAKKTAAKKTAAKNKKMVAKKATKKRTAKKATKKTAKKRSAKKRAKR